MIVINPELRKFNDEEKNLHLLIEECSETIQMKSKIYRFGFNDRYPTEKSRTNRERLEKEIGHVLAAIEILVANETVDKDVIEAHKSLKLRTLPEWYFVVAK